MSYAEKHLRQAGMSKVKASHSGGGILGYLLVLATLWVAQRVQLVLATKRIAYVHTEGAGSPVVATDASGQLLRWKG